MSKKLPPHNNVRKATQDHWLRERTITEALKAEYALQMNQPLPKRLKKLVEEIRQQEREANKKKS